MSAFFNSPGGSENRTVRIGALITCHNRRDKTLACIRSIFEQQIDPLFRVDVYVVDDGSTDGTSDAISLNYPVVKLIKGDGQLFWNGGMRVAFEEARQRSYDYYLWVNDDTLLVPRALQTLIDAHVSTSKQGYGMSIIAGSTCDPVTGSLTYGGWKEVGGANLLKLAMVTPEKNLIQCDTINGNCVLIPREVVQTIGNLDPAFTHSMGDIDYGFRAKKAGCTIWVASGYAGTCELNSGQGLWTDLAALPLWDRWEKLLGPKGLPPKEWFIFTRRYSGRMWPFYWINPYVKFWVKGLFNSTNGKP